METNEVANKRNDILLSFPGSHVLCRDGDSSYTVRDLVKSLTAKDKGLQYRWADEHKRKGTLEVFVDEKIAKSHDRTITNNILNGLLQTRGGGVVAILVTKTFFQRKWCRTELLAAMKLAKLPSNGISMCFIGIGISPAEVERKVNELILPGEPGFEFDYYVDTIERADLIPNKMEDIRDRIADDILTCGKNLCPGENKEDCRFTMVGEVVKKLETNPDHFVALKRQFGLCGEREQDPNEVLPVMSKKQPKFVLENLEVLFGEMADSNWKIYCEGKLRAFQYKWRNMEWKVARKELDMCYAWARSPYHPQWTIAGYRDATPTPPTLTDGNNARRSVQPTGAMGVNVQTLVGNSHATPVLHKAAPTRQQPAPSEVPQQVRDIPRAPPVKVRPEENAGLANQQPQPVDEDNDGEAENVVQTNMAAQQPQQLENEGKERCCQCKCHAWFLIVPIVFSSSLLGLLGIRKTSSSFYPLTAVPSAPPAHAVTLQPSPTPAHLRTPSPTSAGPIYTPTVLSTGQPTPLSLVDSNRTTAQPALQSTGSFTSPGTSNSNTAQPMLRSTVSPAAPTTTPSDSATARPSNVPSNSPVARPSVRPSEGTTAQPISRLTGAPISPPILPANIPTAQPSIVPSNGTTAQPVFRSTGRPTAPPSVVPSISDLPQPTSQSTPFPTSPPAGHQ